MNESQDVPSDTLDSSKKTKHLFFLFSFFAAVPPKAPTKKGEKCS